MVPWAQLRRTISDSDTAMRRYGIARKVDLTQRSDYWKPPRGGRLGLSALIFR
jgi:hypothetical protein